jgi:hypothetical protein
VSYFSRATLGNPIYKETVAYGLHKVPWNRYEKTFRSDGFNVVVVVIYMGKLDFVDR